VTQNFYEPKWIVKRFSKCGVLNHLAESVAEISPERISTACSTIDNGCSALKRSTPRMKPFSPYAGALSFIGGGGTLDRCQQ